MVQCPSCARVQEPRIVCAECGAPLAAALDCFAAMGLPTRLQIDTSHLEHIYYDLGRRIHPDRFATSPVKIRDASLRATAMLTRAYRTLRDPVSRGLYWLELNGRKLAENNQVPADLAEMVFDVQEELAEFRQAREAESMSGEMLGKEIAGKHEELKRAMDGLRGELAANFARFDAQNGDSRDELFTELKSILSKIAYLKTLIRDVDRELDTAKAA
jgi:molecular chaperone HscB